jgi:hypothetical protein
MKFPEEPESTRAETEKEEVEVSSWTGSNESEVISGSS